MLKHVLLFLVLAAMLALTACGGQEPPEEQPPLLPLEEQQRAVQAFQDQLTKIDQDATKKMWPDFLVSFESYVRRPFIPAVDMYDIAASVKKACDLTGAAIAATPIPEGLPPDVVNALDAAKTKLFEAWALRESGVGDFMKYIETNRLAYATSAREKFEYARGAVEEAAENMVAAKVLVGLTSPQPQSTPKVLKAQGK